MNKKIVNLLMIVLGLIVFLYLNEYKKNFGMPKHTSNLQYCKQDEENCTYLNIDFNSNDKFYKSLSSVMSDNNFSYVVFSSFSTLTKSENFDVINSEEENQQSNMSNLFSEKQSFNDLNLNSNSSSLSNNSNSVSFSYEVVISNNNAVKIDTMTK